MTATAPSPPSSPRASGTQPALPSLTTTSLSRGSLELKQFMRDRRSMVFTFALPLILLLIFGSIFNKDIVPGVTFSQYFVAGMIASGLVYTGFQNPAIVIPQEREDGTMKRLAGTPLPKAAYFLGKGALVLVSLVVQVAALLLVGVLFFKVHLPSTPEKWFTFLWLLGLGLICCTLLGIAFSSVPKTARGAPALVSPVVLVLQFISGVFIIYAQLPDWMRQIASLFPLKWLCQGMRSVFLPDSFRVQETAHAWELGKVALVLGIWIVIGIVLCRLTFHWQRSNEH